MRHALFCFCQGEHAPLGTACDGARQVQGAGLSVSAGQDKIFQWREGIVVAVDFFFQPQAVSFGKAILLVAALGTTEIGAQVEKVVLNTTEQIAQRDDICLFLRLLG